MARNVTPIKSKQAYLNDMSDVQLACRIKHDWPSDRLRAGMTRLPKNIHLHPQTRDGVYLVVELCLNGCGKERKLYTLPRGIMDDVGTYRYKDPADWVRVPADVGLTKRDVKKENWDRVLPQLLAQRVVGEIA